MPAPPAEPNSDKRHSAEILPSMYEELRKLAAIKMAGEKSGHTLGATALVHEAYLNLSKDESNPRWDNRGHFYSSAAEAMRRILIDRARQKKAVRHGGEWERTELDSINAPTTTPDKADELLALDEALNDLAKEDARKARLVELRYFIGLSVEEAAEILEISSATAKRDWSFARAWLHRAITEKLAES